MTTSIGAAAAGWTVAEPAAGAGVTIWLVDLALSSPALTACDAVLSADERARANRFLRTEDRDRYRASHAALRLVLGRALGADPRNLAFAAGPNGKPELAGAVREAPGFNLSHSGRLALRIARGHFSADEAEALAAAPERERVAIFFGLWTRKEAVVKALGAGLALPLDHFSVTLPPAAPRLLRMADGLGGWTLIDLELGPGYAATAAVAEDDVPVVLRALPAGWPSHLL